MAVIKPDETLSPLSLSDFKPQSKLVTRETQVARPRFPVIDAHNHLSLPGFGGWDTRPVAELLDHLDQADVRVYVDLDGGWGEDILHTHHIAGILAAIERLMTCNTANQKRVKSLFGAPATWSEGQGQLLC